jgi:hypothetical protein
LLGPMEHWGQLGQSGPLGQLDLWASRAVMELRGTPDLLDNQDLMAMLAPSVSLARKAPRGP